ncbi:MAG: metal-dependent hydrolase [Acidobacteria bacterium]|nr:metal-dependent hydrolase [Acidobacteriota bacterium]
MDALTHTLVALTIGMAGFRRWGRKGTLYLVAAANLPELERLAALGGQAAWVKACYGAGHSLITAPLLGLLLWALLRRKLGPARALEVVSLGLGSHLVLDLLSGPGVRLLWPFSGAFYGLTLLARYDLLTLLVLGLVLLGPRLLNLVNRDIGAATYRPEKPARVGLVTVALLLVVRLAMLLMVTSRLEAASTSGFSLSPSALHPLTWYAVSDAGMAYTVEEVTANGYGPAFRFRKMETNRALETAAETPLAQAFLEIARFPQYSLEAGDHGMRVRIRDMRFFTPAGQGKEYSVEIEVTPQLQVVAQKARM